MKKVLYLSIIFIFILLYFSKSDNSITPEDKKYIGYFLKNIKIITQKTNSTIKLLLTSGISSHAITEVLTSKDWLVVDSNKRWVAIGNKDNILSTKDIFLHVGKDIQIKWIVEAPSIYNKKFTYIYGLYSRYSKFYPPYNFIPDIKWNEFMFNITEIIGLDLCVQ